MTLNGSQRKQVHTALVAAFDQPGLAMLLLQELDQELDTVAGGKNKAEVVLNLIAWAERQNCISALIAGALRQNPRNPQLVALAQAAATWPLAQPDEPVERAAGPPYQGLAFFDVDDASRFFGREALTAELLTLLRSGRFLAVVGASGSGKSSVVRAGVVPALQAGAAIPGSQRWSIFVITPTSHPLKALAAALTQDAASLTVQATLMDDLAQEPRSLDLFAARWAAKTGAPRLVIVVDQFEELFSLCQDGAERRQFIDNLLTAAAPDGLVTVILTLRADYYVNCAAFDNLRRALERGQRYIGPMAREELRAAIEKPAQLGGWELEEGLVELMLDDVDDQPGALPLLSHALLETWKRRSGRRLLHAGYAAAGGVRGAIAHTAEAWFVALSSEQQALAHTIFSRLTFVSEDMQTLRRRVLLAELVAGEQGPAIASLLAHLQDARLVTSGKAPSAVPGAPASTISEDAIYVEVTHEAVIREWPRLRTWINDNRLWLRVHQMIDEDCREWAQAGQDASYLYGSRRLDQALQWAASRIGELSSDERLFLAQSLIAVSKQDGAAGYYEHACERLRLAATLQPKLAAAHLELYTLALDQRDLATAFAAHEDLRAAQPECGLLPPSLMAECIVDVSDFGPVYLSRCREPGGADTLLAVTLARWPSSERGDTAAQLRAHYAALHSLHIAPLRDIGYWQGRYYLVSDYVAGQTLQARLEQTAPLAAAAAVSLVAALGTALVEGHAHQLWHLGLHPVNVLLTATGPVLVRYGEARLRQELLGPDAPLRPVTPYLAPEQRQGEAGNAASDIYTLGMLAQQLLTGQAPDVRLPVRPSRASRRYDVAFDEWVAHATHPKPAERFATSTQMMEEWGLISGQARRSLLTMLHSGLAGLDRGAQELRRGRLRYAIFLLAGLTLIAEALLPPGPVHHLTRFLLLLIPVAYLLATLFYWQARLKTRQTGAVALVQTGAGVGLMVALLLSGLLARGAHDGKLPVTAGNLPAGEDVVLFLSGATAYAVVLGLAMLLTLQFADHLPGLRRLRPIHVVYGVALAWCLYLVLAWFFPPLALIFRTSV